MAARGTSKRQRNRARRRVLGAIPVALGVLLWGGAAIMRVTVGHFLPEAMIYLGITVGGGPSSAASFLSRPVCEAAGRSVRNSTGPVRRRRA